MVVTNHTYDVIGSMFPQKEMGGGSGLKYAASSIIYLSKKKFKDGTEVIGNIIHCKNHKSRLTMENKIRNIFEILEEAISYEDWNKVEEVRKEILFLLDELESGFPSHFDEYD